MWPETLLEKKANPTEVGFARTIRQRRAGFRLALPYLRNDFAALPLSQI
jgi:hypothetical protein